MHRALVIDQALYVLGLLPSFRTVEIAELALSNGHDADSIVELAMLSKDKVIWSEVDNLFKRTLAALNCPAIGIAEAQVIVLKYLAEQFCSEKMSARSFLDYVYTLSFGIDDGAISNSRLLSYVSEVDYLDSMYTSVKPADQAGVWNQAILNTCRQLLDELPTTYNDLQA